MAKRSLRKYGLLAASGILLLCQVPAFAWDEGFIGLTVPSRSFASLSIDPEISHRFLINDPEPWTNVRVNGAITLLDFSRLTIGYQTGQREFFAELAGWYTADIFRFGGAAELLRSNLFEDAWSGAFTVFGTADIVPDIFTAALNLQYDLRYQLFNTGAGLSLALVPGLLSVETEVFLSVNETDRWGWNAGFLLKTTGHQFHIFVGNGNEFRMRTALAENASPDKISIGFIIRRRIDAYFDVPVE